MRKQLFAMTAVVAFAGCAGDSSTNTNDRPEFLSADGTLSYVTESGAVVTGGPIKEYPGAYFEIRKGDQTFGFELSETKMTEWASDSSGRDELTVEYGFDQEVVGYVINGKRHERAYSEIPEWSLARARFGGESDVPMGLPVDKLRVYNNKLGNELARTLEHLGGELQARSPMNEDGTCGSAMMTVITACLRYKCPIGGWANPVCHVCTGTFIACLTVAVMVLGGWV